MTRKIGFLKPVALALPLYVGALAADAADLVETARQSGGFDTLLRALKAAGLAETLQGGGPFTLLAPTDEAFGKLPPATLAELLRPESRDRLRLLLGQHVIEGMRLPSDAIPQQLEPMAGEPVAAETVGGGVTLRRAGARQPEAMARLVGGDIAADNGVIHVIDAVLLPEELMPKGVAATLAKLLPLPAPEAERHVPFAGSLEPSDPPPSPAPPSRPLQDHERHALSALYKRPSEQGPPPVQKTATAISAIGKGQMFRLLPGPEAFPENVPDELKIATGDASPYSRRLALLPPGGEVRFAAIDRTINDTALSDDWMAFEASFTDEEGNDWRIVQLAIAPLSPAPITDPWYGGIAIDMPLHGHSMNSTPEHPQVDCAMCSWGWADVWKNGQKVGSSALLHVMLSSEAHDPAADYEYTCYDCRGRRMGEIHVVVTLADLPTPGGFLHVMWHESEFTRGTPEEITANPAVREPDLPTVTLNAEPYLRWSDTNLEMEAGKPVRLVLNNMDPSSFHGFMVRGPQGVVQVPLEQGSQWVTSLVFDQPGEYEFWCPVSNHRGRGMYGRVVVSDGVPGGSHGVPSQQ